MLLTRCPHCQTTFRITAEALSKAEGQVRCGRCTHIFDAYAELREDERAVESPAAPAGTPTGRVETASGAAEVDVELDAAEDIEISSALSDIDSDSGETTSAASTEQGTDALEPPSDVPADATVETKSTPVLSPEWTVDAEPATKPTRAWRLAAALAAFALLAQAAHHFRANLAGNAMLGPPLRIVYAQLGAPIHPRWDLEQYQVLEWVATAEPGSNGQGNLIITARIQNRAAKAQPYPHVHLRLKDRWESAIGSRVFEPDEYLATDEQVGLFMAPGDTAQARLTVIDPGQDAYGFELDICVHGTTEQLTCAADKVFR